MIIVDNLTKDYLIFSSTLDIFRAMFGKPIVTFRALDRISFNIKRGEVVGVIGNNGAGKTTLLKVLSKISKNTAGKLYINGRSNAIFELSTGFNFMLSGRQNIRRRLMLQGYSSKQIARLEPEIIDFSELCDVVDDPVQTYSTGMAARLSFSVATCSPSEIFFIDEILAVGDEHFQGKCLKKIKEICASGRTVMIVSHGINYVESLCDRAIWLENGHIKMLGDAHTVGMAYLGADKLEIENKFPREFAYIENVSVKIEGSRINITTDIKRLMNSRELHLQIAIHDNNRGILTGLYNTSWDNFSIPVGKGSLRISMSTPLMPGLRKGLVGVAVIRGNGQIPGSIIEDEWGWSNCRQIYFNINMPSKQSQGYVDRPLAWNICS